MLRYSDLQMQTIGDTAFLARVDAALLGKVDDWSEGPPPDRMTFLRECLRVARGLGLTSEQGVVSYVLGATRLGIGFENESALLVQLLGAPLPELRRSHGMNEWVADRLGPTPTADSGDAAIRASYRLTEPWGRL